MVRLNLGVEMSACEGGLRGRIFMGKASQNLLHWLNREWKSIVWTAEVRGCRAEDLDGKADQKEKSCEVIHGETLFCVCMDCSGNQKMT